MIDSDAYIRRLEESNPLREPVLRAAVQALRLPAGSRGLDIGCGIGLQAQLLAEAVGATGRVTGLDVSPALLSYALRLSEKSGLVDRLSWQQGDMSNLPFADDTFDWVWSADCVGYPAGDLLPVLKEMARVVKPGGSIAILAWSAQQALPGYPLLEARLNATGSWLVTYFRDKMPSASFVRALGWFREAGLEEATGRTFVGDVQAPLSSCCAARHDPALRDALGRAPAGGLGRGLAGVPTPVPRRVARLRPQPPRLLRLFHVHDVPGPGPQPRKLE